MKKTLLFAAILLACTNLRAQLFTKIANQIIVEDSANNVGVAWGDYDNDGDMDLYTTVWNTSPNDPLMNGILYQNNCNGSFTKITALPGGIVSDPNVGTGAYWLDYNNDGNLDLYTWDSRDPTKSNSLFKNLGNGSFEKVNTAVSSIRTNRINCAFADFNNDGWLDFYTGDSSIYISDKQGNFTRLSPSPIFRNTDPTRTALYCSASCVDYNNDGYMDLLVIVAISQPSGMWGNYLFMYTNNGHGGFRQDTLAPPYYDWFPNYGHTWGDYDNDGNLDLWVNGNPPYPNHLFHNNGNGTFTEVHTGPVIAVQPYNNQGGASFCDYNNDGWLDLFQPTLYQNILFDNNGDGTFMQDTTEIVTKDTPAESYGAGWVDYNNDGAMDLFVPTGWANADDYLYKNVIYQNRGNTNHWLKFKCIGERSNKDAIGARIYAKATINGKSVTQMREINANTTSAGESGGASGHVVHMGFGNASFIDTLKIVWPASHTTQIFTHVPANQFLQITESVNTLSDVAACKPDLPARNPGYVTGKLFNDVNNNCTYDAGVDLPIANKLIKASPGPYYVYTDNDGNYTFSLPAGTYTISQNLQEDNWVRESCQADSFMVTVTPRDTEKNKNFAVTELAKVPCNGNYGLTIYSISVDHDNCPSNILLTNPCPGYKWEYCFRITNNTTMITPAGSVLALNFPVGYHILSVSCPCSITSSSLGTNTMNVTFNNSFVIGGQCQVCVVVHIDIGTNLPFITQATYSQSGTTTNLINNPDFKTTIPPLGFSSAYNYGLCFPSGYHIGTFAGCPGVPPICSNCGWHQYGVGGVGNFLIADGFETATPPPPFSTPYVWREVISPVAINTRYNFSFWYTNIEKQNSGNALPNLTVLINGTTAITTGPIPENSVWYNKSYQWCADSTHANIRIISTDYDATGNDFGIDSINFNNTTYAGPIFLVQNNSCGCDPNDKNVSPQGCGINGNISKNEQLTYRVRFQNTGTGPAHNILLRDALDPNLDINTLQIIASSHPITSAQIIPTNTLIVEFDNIELPDSASNPEGSRGFIVFSISPKAGLPDGTTIKDQSGIYFDSNAVVLTNSTINTLYDNPQPDAHFKYKHSCSDPGLAYDFTYTGNTPGNANYFWTFNDASPATSTVQNPSNIIFNSSGYKLVTLTVNRNGCSEIVTDTINVNSPLSNDGKKVTICHKGQTITISINALPAHLAHGDCVGPCNSNNKSRIAVLNEQSEDAIYDFNIVPNPSDGKFTILVTGNTDGNTSASLENENIDACIYDILGNIIYKSRIYSYSTLIDLSNYSKGIYLYKITSPKNFIFTGKIIIQ